MYFNTTQTSNFKYVKISACLLTVLVFTIAETYAQFSIARGLPGCVSPILSAGLSCDGDPSTFAVNAANELIVNNIAGNLCCASANNGGDHNAFFEFPVFNIVDYNNVSISFAFMSSSTAYEDLSPTTPITACQGAISDDQHDQIRFTYSIDGGPEVLGLYVHGTTQSEFTSVWNTMPLNGNTLRVRVYVSNNDVDETFIFKNFSLSGFPKMTAGPDKIVCAGDVVNLEGEHGGLWTGGLGTFSNPNSPTSSYTMADPAEFGTTVTLTYTGIGPATPGCAIPTDQMDIIINPYLDPSFTFDDFCEGSPGLPDNVLTSGGIFSFVIPPTDGAQIKPETGEISGAQGGSVYIIKHTTVGACPESKTVIVTVNQIEDSEFEFEDFCIEENNGPVNIATLGGAFSFMPEPFDGTTIDPLSGVISGATTGNTYFVKYRVEGLCPSETIISVFAKPLYAANLPNIGPFCFFRLRFHFSYFGGWH
jgi:hypothetical protein